jgi:glucose/arabinose dehydrogenase
VVVYDKYPNDEHHGWKYIAFGPDGYLYVPVGMPCNICFPESPIYGTITRLRPDGSGFEIYASGIRNTVGFDWQPVRKELWFTDNGRDMMGDNRPPDELNRVIRKGQNFGFPYCHGINILDPEFGKGHNCTEFTPPEVELGPHVAALGMKFYTGNMFPAEYKNRIFIAEHGSWNRTVPIGYRITLVTLMDGTPQEYKVFAEGWLDADGTAWGRPVDVLIMHDGSMLVSDDKAGVIYRISHEAGAGE